MHEQLPNHEHTCIKNMYAEWNLLDAMDLRAFWVCCIWQVDAIVSLITKHLQRHLNGRCILMLDLAVSAFSSNFHK